MILFKDRLNKKNPPLSKVPVFTVVITLKKEGQPLLHNPEKSLLFVKTLQ